MTKKIIAGTVSSITALALLVLQNGGMVLGMLTVAQTKLAPEIQAIQQSQIRAAVVGFAVLWIGFGVYRLLGKAVDRLS